MLPLFPQQFTQSVRRFSTRGSRWLWRLGLTSNPAKSPLAPVSPKAGAFLICSDSLNQRPKRRLLIILARRRVQAWREPTHGDLNRGECHE